MSGALDYSTLSRKRSADMDEPSHREKQMKILNDEPVRPEETTTFDSVSEILKLPFELLDTILSHVDDKSLLALRMVSKTMKSIAEATSINRLDSPIIDVMTVSGEVKTAIKISFCFEKLEFVERMRGKLFLMSAFNYLQLSSGFQYSHRKVSSTMTAEQAGRFTNQLNPFMHKTAINSLELHPSTTTLFNLVSTMFEDRIVPTLAFTLQDSKQSRTFLKRLILKLQTNSLRLNIADQISGQYLVELAGMVDSITISATKRNWFAESPLNHKLEDVTEESLFLRHASSIRLLTLRILARRCSYFDLSEAEENIAAIDANILAFSLHYRGIINKPVYFAARTVSAQSRDVEMGCVVEVREDDDGSRLVEVTREMRRMK